RVVILADDLKAHTPGVACDCSALPAIAVLLAADVGCRARAQIGYRWDLGPAGHGSGVQTRVTISGGTIGTKRLSAVGSDVGTTPSGRQKRDPARRQVGWRARANRPRKQAPSVVLDPVQSDSSLPHFP